LNVFMVYGESIESDLDFDALPRATRIKNTILIQVERVSSIKKDTGISVRPCTAQGRTVHIVSHASHVSVQVDLVLGFELWLSSRRIYCLALDGTSEDLLKYWILQQIIPLFLLLNGSTEFLHGMAVSAIPYRNDQSGLSCIGFLGPSYAGKSTLLSYFLARGHALVTDDQLALSRRDYTEVLPAPPFYRAYRAAEELGVCAALYSAAATQLQRLYLLAPAPSGTGVLIERLFGMDAVTALFPNIHYSLHNSSKPDCFPLVENRFRGIADVSRRIPIARLYVPRNLNRLSEVYDLIQNDRMN